MSDVIPPLSAPSKADPETLVLRAQPARVTRFKRGAIILLAGVAAAGIASAAWLALTPVSLNLAPAEDERSTVAAKSPSDLLAGAPASYDDVPPLGPPLPGDLGRPILNHQRDLQTAGVDPVEQAAELERQRLAAERRAARESGIILQGAGRSGSGATGELSQALRSREAGGSDASSPLQTAGAELDDDRASQDINPHRLASPASAWTLQAGSIIAASLITGLNSDLPGLVTAQITENVYDTVTGRTLLIPQGSRLIGRYESNAAFGQSRALVVWQRILLLDGASIRIDNVPATDTEGYAGLSDRIDGHSWQLLKGVALSTVLGVGTELGWGSSEGDLVRAVRESVQQGGPRAGDRLVMRQLDVKPSLRVRPGWPVRVVVHTDIVLRPWAGGEHG